MNLHHLWWIIPLTIFLILAVIVFVTWLWMSFSNFPKKVYPGETYQVGDRTYQIPHLPHMVYGSTEKPNIHKPVPMLAEDTLKDLRELIINSFGALKECKVEFWVTGGTLISAMLWKHLMCYDDDCDVSVDWKYREYLWSPEFASFMDKKGLEVFFLRGSSLNMATREGAAVRIRKKGTYVPTVDIFFTKEREDGSYAKVNTWYGDKLTFAKNEVWENKEWIYPIQTHLIDDMEWPLPAKAKAMLDTQYGDEWSTTIKSPNPLTNSHKWAFWISNTFFAWRKGQVQKSVEDFDGWSVSKGGGGRETDVVLESASTTQTQTQDEIVVV